jgi:valyl-tRNA synthetase
MRARYEHWVQNLGWDWAISRQRYFGVPFPAWHCAQCGATLLADESQLPLDPATAQPPRPCAQSGSADLRPDEDVMDTWMTSSLSQKIAGQMLEAPELYAKLFPMALRPQAHDIIRTWAFYTIVKAYYHFGALPWAEVMISGHVLTATGEKQSKSKLNAASDPTSVIPRFGADAVRYWACDGALGSDLVLSEERMRDGQRLLSKLWSAARFAAGVLQPTHSAAEDADAHQGIAATALSTQHSALSTPIDRALLSKLAALIEAVTAPYERYDYAGAKALVERFFWADLCDSYLELAKGRLYGPDGPQRAAAQRTLASALLAVLKLFAPILPHITEELHARLFGEERGSIHTSAWPEAAPGWRDAAAERAWDAAVAAMVAARRFKTAHHLGMGTPLARLSLATDDAPLAALLQGAGGDIVSATRASELAIAHGAGEGDEIAPGLWALIEG